MARPTKFTPEVIDVILQAIGLGASRADAAWAAGVDYDTLNKWINEGKEAKSGKFFEFIGKIREAEAKAVLRHLSVINNAAAKGDWKASERWLRMYRPTEWNEKMEVNHGGETKVELVVRYDNANNKPTDPA